jgi:hypothetical protein
MFFLGGRGLFTSDVRTRFDDNVILSVQSHYLSFFEFGLVTSVEFSRFISNTPLLCKTSDENPKDSSYIFGYKPENS